MNSASELERFTPGFDADFGMETGWADEEETAPCSAEWFHVRPGDDRECTLLLPRADMVRYWGHWVQTLRRFQPCGGGQEFSPLCPHCRRYVGKQVRYVQAVVDPLGTQWLWEFGEVQWKQLKDLMKLTGQPLEGLPLRLKRLAAPGSPPVIVNQVEPWLDAGALPVPVDVKMLLRGVFVRQALMRGKADDEAGRRKSEPTPSDPDQMPAPPTPKAALSKPEPSVPQSCPDMQTASTSDLISPPLPSAFALDYERKCGIPFDKAIAKTKAVATAKETERRQSARRGENTPKTKPT